VDAELQATGLGKISAICLRDRVPPVGRYRRTGIQFTHITLMKNFLSLRDRVAAGLASGLFVGAVFFGTNIAAVPAGAGR